MNVHAHLFWPYKGEHECSYTSRVKLHSEYSSARGASFEIADCESQHLTFLDFYGKVICPSIDCGKRQLVLVLYHITSVFSTIKALMQVYN